MEDVTVSNDRIKTFWLTFNVFLLFFLLLFIYLFDIFCSTENYLGNSEIWNTCKEPNNVVEFNIGLFATLLVAACLELLLCLFQVLNGLFGCICGTCNRKEVCTVYKDDLISKGQSLIHLLHFLLMVLQYLVIH